ncbi:MAG: hypothetical protein CYPHOPRED_005903 [Cyphobasidiales sp. Tagirdzhanova-0007]|nr:MAG: hypothetical protein CYPHOPRED_005903 [Cyphobasidiales sp. Tagirdzhanova-0007]
MRQPPPPRLLQLPIAPKLPALVAGYGLALVAPPSIYKLLFPAPVLLNPTADSPAGIAAAKAIEEDLQALPIVKLLREELLDTEPAQTSPNTTSLSSEQSSLRGPGMFAVPAILFSTSDDKESIAVIHAGDALCGHNGIIHGGLLATILDEALARPAFFSLPNKIGMTAYLNTRYKKPTKADQFLVVKVRCNKVQGRKAFLEGHIETLDGIRVVEGDALYVEPKEAWLLKKSAILQAFEQ